MHRKMNARFGALILSIVMVFSMILIPKQLVHAEDTGVGDFVNRCYQVTLGREADSDGFADWTSQLTEGRSDGATVAWGFVFSPEYTKLNKDNGAFVTDMYTLFLGRTPDETGFNDWKGQLDSGVSREAVFAGFANSVEFFEICTGYGVTAGYFTNEYDKNQVNGVNMFVARMYGVCFGRLGDQGGQADWCNRLLKGELTGIDCANGFINSREYKNLGLSNSDYVKNMYRAFMGREADEAGYNDWVAKLAAGYTRDEVFAGFANSNEFQDICDSYGIIRGNYEPGDVHEAKEPEHGWRIKKATHEDGSYTIYTYDDPEYTEKRMRYRADGSEWAVEYLKKPSEDGKKMLVFEQHISNAYCLAEYLQYETIHQTETSCNMIKTRTNDDGSEIFFTTEEDYSKYAGKGFLLKGSHEKGNPKYSDYEAYESYERDDAGNLLKYTRNYKAADPVEDFSENHVYIYDEQGRPIEDKVTQVNSGVAHLAYRFTYHYNEQGLLAREIKEYYMENSDTYDKGYDTIYEYEQY
ncbi:MAG: DUF4214 domain-containing protein [Lachnospiraceae bacterium]|nr:DUF4214 domain-containing protein [Lachnospiraceae bacterium]